MVAAERGLPRACARLLEAGANADASVDRVPPGPALKAALKGKIDGGEINRETLVWAQGMTGWAKAGEVPALSGLFAAVPPPLPPGA